MTRASRSVLTAVAALGLAAPLLGATDWPQWLGPRQDGTSSPGLFRGAKVRLRKAWSVPIEGGRSGLTVAGGRLFTQVPVEEDEYALAVDAATGREVWRRRLDPLNAAMPSGPASTPAVREGRVFALSSACILRALDAKDGAVLWEKDFKQAFGSAPRLGCSAAPAIDGGRVVIQAAGKDEHRFAAFDPATGAVAWTSKGVHRTGYASAVVADLGGVRQVVGHHVIPGPPPRGGLVGLRASDGHVLWSHDLPEHVSWETPLVVPGDRVLLLTWNGGRLVRVTRSGDTFAAAPVWDSRDLKSQVSPPVFHQGRLFGFTDDDLVSIDVETGKIAWRERLYAGSVSLVDGRLVVLSNTAGLVRVADASPDGYKERAQLQVFRRGASAATPPTADAQRIYVRSEEEIAAVAVEGAGGAAAAGAAASGDPLAAEIERWAAFLRDHPATDDLGKQIRGAAEPAVKQARDALAAGRRLWALQRLVALREQLAAAEFLDSHTPDQRKDIAAFEAEWKTAGAEVGPAAVAAAPIDLAGLRPALLRALAEAARAQVAVYYNASLEYGRSTTAESGIYYLGAARAQRRLLDLARSLSSDAAGAPSPPFRGLAGELDDLEADLLKAYRPPASVDQHTQFILANSVLNEARQLDAAGARHGAMLRYLQAVLRSYPVRGATPPGAAELAVLRRDVEARLAAVPGDHTIARMFLEMAQQDPAQEAAVVTDVAPRYLAALQPARPRLPRPDPKVRVTLVRWPYT